MSSQFEASINSIWNCLVLLQVYSNNRSFIRMISISPCEEEEMKVKEDWDYQKFNPQSSPKMVNDYRFGKCKPRPYHSQTGPNFMTANCNQRISAYGSREFCAHVKRISQVIKESFACRVSEEWRSQVQIRWLEPGNSAKVQDQ